MRTAILIALLLVVPALSVAGGAEDKQDWRMKADEPLLGALDAGESPLKLVIQGPSIPEPLNTPADRAAWRAHWEAHAAPFFSAIRDRVDAYGGEVTLEVPAVNAMFVVLPSERVPTLLGRSDVRRAGLDYEGATQILGGVDGSLPGVLPNLPETIAKVQATEMWAEGYRGAGIKLAVIDTGIRPTHEMMRFADGTTRVVEWYDATTPVATRCATPCDANGHGTHVGTTAAGSNLWNPNSPQGVAPEAEVWGIRIFRGGGGEWAWAQEGLQAAFDLGADVTTNSWGGGCSSGGDITAELAETLQNAGMMNVFAAGNSGFGGVLCPGRVHNILTVGGIDINDNIYSSSSRGPCVWPLVNGVSRICPDVNAVAVSVVAGYHTSDTAYASLTGTSMATPHVAGVVVLLEQAKRALTGGGMSAAQMEAEILLRYTAKDLGPGGPDNDFGWGTAQALSAYNLLANADPLNLIDLFQVERAELRAYQTSGVAFSLANLGAATLNGQVTHKVEQTSWGQCPGNCYVQVITDAPLSMSPFSEFTSRAVLDGAVLPAGEYLVTATYAFTYIDPADGLLKSGLVERSGTFVVKKVHFVIDRMLPTEANVGDVLFAGVELVNLGNEDASNVRFTQRYRAEGPKPLAAVPPGIGAYGAFANPAPDEVNHAGTNPLMVRYEWTTIGGIAQGASWEASYNFVADQTGTWPFPATLRYLDETGRPFTLELQHNVVVSLPVS